MALRSSDSRSNGLAKAAWRSLAKQRCSRPKSKAAEKTNLLLKQLKETDGARLIAQTTLLTTDGRQAQVQIQDEQLVDGENHSLGPAIDILPVISADRSAVDMTLNAGVNRPLVR